MDEEVGKEADDGAKKVKATKKCVFLLFDSLFVYLFTALLY